MKISDEGLHIVEEKKKSKKKKNENDKIWSRIALVSEIGFVIAIPIAGGAIFGAYLDRKFGTAPKLTLSLLFTGLFLGTYNVYRIIKDV
ncbi:MAG: hypothetical protein UT63_C0079G0008 [Candidatus Gottesmanbacteria bacterium GW2011_GWC2_39_8]|uniref:ATP synthase protein I n=1 Tax=Candidatus Gottesmanbacteria bacterium GW2011_GWC2_39_8 TaxID=1618450 RepID=A0A0G0S8X7_9BACT|nr:MAG: hypothetical protein UT63_C0079G0008 [Candidatus Gottesmanbacteria bacterium GW2011_GWC2_39_8]